jgi:sulfatase modifying factor 1
MKGVSFMKRILCMTLSLILCFSCFAVFAADETQDLSILLQIGNPQMLVNGVEKEIDFGRGTAPILQNNRTLLPVRAIVEEMGGTVLWDGASQEVTLSLGANEIRLVIDSTTAYLNDTAQTLDVAPTVLNDRTMLPIRFIAESFKFSVDWNETEQMITITKTGNTDVNIEATDDFVLINGGTFQMGSPDNEPERDADERLHEVSVDSFYLAKTELTQQEYQAVTGSNPSEFQGAGNPVENVTWYDAIRFCNTKSEAEGLSPCYTISGTTVTWDKSANGYRLPTEAEWEYAARANTDTPFSFGSYVNDEDANCYNAYGYNNNASGQWVNGYLEHTVSTDSYLANGNGLYNMHGNVAEWVWDWYGSYSEEASLNPTGMQAGNYKIARGGGWNDFPKHIRSAYRSAYPADVPLYSIGIRLARNAVDMTGTVTSENHANADGRNKTLIVYFSQTGNTDGFANIIAEMTGADIFRVERKTPYSATGNSVSLYAEALTEYRENAVPDLNAYLEDAGLDINQYDTILLGYCNWWASIPAPIRTFLTHYDFSGKTIIPFCSMGGGRFGQTISAVAKLAPNSTIQKGLAVTYSSYNRDEIATWLAENQIEMVNAQ